MKIKTAFETVLTVSATELAIVEFVMAGDGEILRDAIKPIFRYLIHTINELEDETIKTELPVLLRLLDLLEANFQKSNRQLHAA